MTEGERIVEGQLRECYGRVVYSHKTHEKCADMLLKRQGRIKLGQVALSALVTGGVISTFFDNGKIGASISVVLSSILLVLNSYVKDYNLGEMAQKHRRAGSDLWLIRERYLSLLTDLRAGGAPLDAIRGERDRLAAALHTVYEGAPSTNFKAYSAAHKGLTENQEMTFSDDEIDAFLPKELRKLP